MCDRGHGRKKKESAMLKQHWAMRKGKRNGKEDMLELDGGAPHCLIKVSGSVIAATQPHVPASRGLIEGL